MFMLMLVHIEAKVDDLESMYLEGSSDPYPNDLSNQAEKRDIGG